MPADYDPEDRKEPYCGFILGFHQYKVIVRKGEVHQG